MKVLFLNTYDDPAESGGGAEVTIRNLIMGLKRSGVEPVMLSTSSAPGLVEHERDGIRMWRAGLRNVYWPGEKVRAGGLKRAVWHALDSHNPFMQGYLRKVLALEKPDLVSVHNLPGWSAAAWSTIHRARIPIVQVLHDQYLLCPKATMFKSGHNCAQRCGSCKLLRITHPVRTKNVSAVVGVSQFILDRHLQAGYFKETPITRVIHNARDPEVLGVNSASLTREDDDIVRVGFIGRLDESKGIRQLITAFKSISTLTAELWIAGSGEPAYEKEMWALANSPQIRFLGRVAPRDFYPNVDLTVVPSMWQEPLGMVVAESLAFGKPVIASRRGGIPEMIEHGRNGLLVDPTNAEDFANSLLKLVSDKRLRIDMGVQAVRTARPFVNMVRWIDAYTDTYLRVSHKVRTLQEN